ncbi:MAG: hypothetical protein ACU0CA_15325 [Paracoccaceae bacterium]
MANSSTGVQTITLRRQYHFRPSGDHTLIWDVSRLVDLAQDIPATQIPLSEIRELDEPYWFAATNDAATCRAIAAHMQQVTAADLTYPILLCAEGRIMDGMHRVIKALNKGQETITAIRFPETPPHDFIDIAPEDLVYD